MSKLGFKTMHAMWIYNSGTGKLKCLGDTSNTHPGDPVPNELFWTETDGYKRYDLFFKRKLSWFDKESDEAMKHFKMGKRGGIDEN